jgi:hypothetical protein
MLDAHGLSLIEAEVYRTDMTLAAFEKMQSSGVIGTNRPMRGPKVLSYVADISSMDTPLPDDCEPLAPDVASGAKAKDALRKARGLPSWEEDVMAFGEWIEAGAPEDPAIDAIMGRLDRGD